MPLFTESHVRTLAASRESRAGKSASRLLSETFVTDGQAFDVFLSHSSNEPEQILLGVKLLLQEFGLAFYVDRYDDPHLASDRVTAETAQLLRKRMRQSRSLVYVDSQYSRTSRWMPWELGYFDGHKGTVGVLPIATGTTTSYLGQEY